LWLFAILTGFVFTGFAVTQLFAKQWGRALVSLVFPAVIACQFAFDGFSLTPEAIWFADKVRFEMSAHQYSAESERAAGPVGKRFLIWPWREFDFGRSQPWFVQLVYDESDELRRRQNERSGGWRARASEKDRSYEFCEIEVRHLQGHFYLATLTC
jgi:hypothetical protein